MHGEPNKVCAACGKNKPATEFYANTTAPDGFSARCKPCRRVQVAQHRKTSNEYYKQYFKNLEKTEQRKQQRTRYRREALADPERREKLASRVRSWRQRNPAAATAQWSKRRAREYEVEGSYTAEEFETLCEEYGNVCLRCGDKDAPLTPDHVVPLSLGGSNWISNIQPLCRRCNSRKNIKIIDYRPGGISLA
jgi:5-methylcytosine-specific restriction endonuclease McrA